MTHRACVVGRPVHHSLSPAIFQFMSSRLGRPMDYRALDLTEEGLPACLEELRREAAFVGLNVTMPYKVLIQAHLDALAPSARDVGAVNVIAREGGRLVGHNTDVAGVLHTVRGCGWCAEGAQVWIWGAGGAARAVAVALARLGAARVWLAGRRPPRAQEVAGELGRRFPLTHFEVAPADPAAVGPLSLVVNATPAGSTLPLCAGSHAERLPFAALEKLPLRPDVLVFDLLYTPQTALLSLAQAMGLRGVGGLGMLVEQALATWALWFGEAPHGGLRAELLAHLRRVDVGGRPIFLVGMMGAGKSTVGPLLARALGLPFCDTDREVEATLGAPVAEIFRAHGEGTFRAQERRVVEAAIAGGPAVVALGGGAVTDPELARRLAQAGVVVYLRAPAEVLWSRLKAELPARPLLAEGGEARARERLEALLEQRRSGYEAATRVVDTTHLPPHEVVERLIDLLSQGGGG